MCWLYDFALSGNYRFGLFPVREPVVPQRLSQRIFSVSAPGSKAPATSESLMYMNTRHSCYDSWDFYVIVQNMLDERENNTRYKAIQSPRTLRSF